MIHYLILMANPLKCRGGHMRHFLITYKENKRNGLEIVMHRKISISKPTGDIGLDAKAAVGVFINSLSFCYKFITFVFLYLTYIL